MNARRAVLRVTYNDKDISADISDRLSSFTYTDHAEGKLDTISIKLENIDGLWSGSWLPSKGAIIKAWIDVQGWGGLVQHHAPRQTFEDAMWAGANIPRTPASPKSSAVTSLYCGRFQVDEIEESGPPDIVTISGISAVADTGLRREKKSRGWENLPFKTIAQQIAAEHSMSLHWDPAYTLDTSSGGAKRYDQRDESDLAFLQRVLSKYALNLKCAEEKIIVYAEKDFLSRSTTLKIPKNVLTSRSFRTKAHNIYSGVELSYSEPRKKTTHTYKYPDGEVKGQILKVNARADSPAAAERQAKAALEKANKYEVTVNFNMPGDPAVRASFLAELQGFHAFNGRYFLDTVTHNLGSGYTLSAEGHKV